MDGSQLQGHPSPKPAVTVAMRNMENQLLRMRQGEITNDEFRPSRTILGVYGQRQPEEYMVRVRVPFGGLSPAQLRTLAEIAREHGNGAAHVTTRQNVQLHWLKLEKMADILWTLRNAGMTTLQTGGNSVRTVAACPLAGVCPKEAFDVTPYAQALDDHYLGNQEVMALPRKVKMAFSGCAQDCAYAAIQDFGAIAQVQGTNGATRKGFRVLVGGGLGVFPRMAQVLEEFLPEENLYSASDAVIRVFDKLGDRHNKQKARLKFVLARRGIEEFRSLVAKEQQNHGTTSNGTQNLDTHTPHHDPPSPLTQRPSDTPVPDDPSYHRWVRWNASVQRQTPFVSVLIPVRLGDVTSAQMEAVAGLAERLGAADVRTSQQQDLVLRNVPASALPEVYQTLSGEGLTSLRAWGIANVTTCPGASACSLGIVSAKALAGQLSQMLQASAYQEDEALGGLRIKVSGCPDSCGHHYLADIGLYGCALHQEGRLYPAYQILLGGEVTQEGTRFARPIAKIPARLAPQVVASLLQTYRSARNPEEGFSAFVDRIGTETLRQALAGFTRVPSPDQDPSFYMDWDATQMYILQRGEGECAV
ncbi:MAG: nitrite/sulfite reductase [Chloroflexi bacterium]|nr:nitrite/sulfite reductase [Chloroflexota bacterium]